MKNKGVYVIAEIGINHNGSLETAFSLIDAVKKAGAQAAKFQYFRAERLYPPAAGTLEWKGEKGRYRYDIYKAVKTFELPRRWIRPLMERCQKKKIDFLCSVFDIEGARFLLGEGVKAFKIPSTAVTHLPLIRFCARQRIPLIMSTGGATLREIEEAVRTVNEHHNDLSLLHCSLSYPVPLGKCNLGVITTLRSAFPQNRIGYSDHTSEVFAAAVQAVYLGAEIVEKHVTFDKKATGPDHFFALEPAELTRMVAEVKRAKERLAKGRAVIDKRLFGSSEKIVFPHERYLREFCFPTLFAKRSIQKGERIRSQDVAILRPGANSRGLEPCFIPLFRGQGFRAAQAVRAGSPLTWEVLFGP